jgi:ribulose kinase
VTETRTSGKYKTHWKDLLSFVMVRSTGQCRRSGLGCHMTSSLTWMEDEVIGVVIDFFTMVGVPNGASSNCEMYHFYCS